jgi:hypothetical protein
VDGADVTAEQRKGDLVSAMEALQEPQHPDSHIEHPGWYKPEVRQKLRDIAEKYPNTEEATTAELWLAVAELEVGQTVIDRAKRREGMLAVASAFARVIKASPRSWQAKAARIGKAAALFGAKLWDEFRVEAGEILTNTPEYKDESNIEYKAFLHAYKMSGPDVEPELRWMLIVAAACEDKRSEAIVVAEELQAKFPEWSAKRKLAGTIELLKSGEKAFGCR